MKTFAFAFSMLAFIFYASAAKAGRCGGSGQSCCTRGVQCNSPLVCSGGLCEPCGQVSWPCCAGSTCNAGLACSGGFCQTCGGGVQPCCPGSVCNANYACVSGTCTWHCQDGVQDFGETGADCGGNVGCVGCPTGGGCSGGSDCASKVCSTNICQAPTCTDNTKNGSETDVDCGGGTCPACADGLVCSTAYPGCVTFHNDYCQSGCCVGTILSCNSGLGGVCGPLHCCDGVVDDGETDVDCGGTLQNSGCGLCNAGKFCSADWDCASSHCVGGVCQ